MSYIDFEDLKDVLGYCLDCCGVDGDDINWVFSEIEQKCHIGKKPDGKKKKKSNKTEIDMILKRLAAVETQAFNQCVGKGAIDRIDSDIRNIREDIRRVKADIAAAKSMAEIAKRRTEVDYSKPKITYRQWDVCRKIIKTCEKNGATKEEIEQLDLIMSKYIPNPIYKEFYNGIKDCSTCKHSEKVNGCEFSDICKNHSDWEAKDNG